MKKTLKMENQEGDFYAESFFGLLFIFWLLFLQAALCGSYFPHL